MPTRSVCAPDAPVLYDLSHRGRYPRPRRPIWIPPLSIPTGLRGEVDRDSCIRAIVWRVGESLRHRLFARVVCLLKCHALFSWRKDTVDYRSNVRHVCHCVSDLAPSKMDFQASPRGGAEADFEALRSILK